MSSEPTPSEPQSPESEPPQDSPGPLTRFSPGSSDTLWRRAARACSRAMRQAAPPERELNLRHWSDRLVFDERLRAAISINDAARAQWLLDHFRYQRPENPPLDAPKALRLALDPQFRPYLELLLEFNADPNGPVASSGHQDGAAPGEPSRPLIVAASFGWLSTIELLISRGARLDLRDARGQTALIVAARGGFDECAQALIHAGSPLDTQDATGLGALGRLTQHFPGYEPLLSSSSTHASASGYAADWIPRARIARSLLLAGAPIERPEALICLACRLLDQPLADALIQRGAPFDALLSPAAARQAMDWPEHLRTLRLRDPLIDAFAERFETQSARLNPAAPAGDAPAPFPTPADEPSPSPAAAALPQQTPAPSAAPAAPSPARRPIDPDPAELDRRLAKIIQRNDLLAFDEALGAACLSASPRPPFSESSPRAPLPEPSLALDAALRSKNELFLGRLLAAGANPDARAPDEPEGFFSPETDTPRSQRLLHRAVSLSKDWAVWALLRSGANPSSRDAGGRTPLIFAARENKPLCAQALIEMGSPLDATDNMGRSALYFALRWPLSEDALARAHASPKDIALDGERLASRAPLALALLEAGASAADPALSPSQQAPSLPFLAAALRSQSLPLARALLRAGANPSWLLGPAPLPSDPGAESDPARHFLLLAQNRPEFRPLIERARAMAREMAQALQAPSPNALREPPPPATEPSASQAPAHHPDPAPEPAPAPSPPLKIRRLPSGP